MIPKEKQDKFFEIIRDTICSYALTGYETEDGGNFTLLDFIASLYPGDDVGPGQHEMDLIIDEVSLALSEGGFLEEEECHDGAHREER